MSMVGSFIVDFDKDNFIVSPYYKVTVNGVLRYSHSNDALKLYSTHINVGDVVTFEIFNTSQFDNNFTLTRYDYTTESNNSDLGVKETTITGVTNSSSFTYTFTASTISIAYSFEYKITGNIQSTCFSYSTLFDGFVKDIKLYNNRIYISGLFSNVNGTSCPHITVLNQDGTFYSGFTNYNATVVSTEIPIEVLTDGKVLFYCDTYSGNSIDGICRLNANGTLDNTFTKRGVQGYLTDIEVQSDGKIIIAGEFNQLTNPTLNINAIVRINSDGSNDATFTSPFLSTDIIQDIAIQSDGKILVMGYIPAYNGICRLNTNGTIDTAFTNPFTLPDVPSSSTIGKISQLSNGKILITGRQLLNNGTYYYLVRLNSNGSIDTTFNNRTTTIDLNDIIGQDFYELSDGSIIIIFGEVFVGDNTVLKIDEDGNQDLTFNNFIIGNVVPSGQKENLVVDETFQKLYVGGDFFSTAFNGPVVVNSNNFVVSNLRGETKMC